ncbi:MAG: hypothetical protein QOE77_1988 [Blastocatellia bacterium]|jgi:hypothetical protein|nr:hypothetical protein [Blastocatellia bacterium]
MKSLTLCLALIAAGSLLACSPTETNTTTNAPASTPAKTPASAPSGSLKDPKSSIAYQFELVKAGDLDKLKAALTERVRDNLTQEVLDKAKNDAANYTIDDLYESADMGESDGQKTAKIKMKNGRTLTTLIETDGQWLADTIWFK